MIVSYITFFQNPILYFAYFNNFNEVPSDEREGYSVSLFVLIRLPR